MGRRVGTIEPPRIPEIPWIRVEEFAGLELFRPVVLVNGAFDILHSGHMKMLFAARQKGPTLVVAMDSDRKVRESKGKGRPVLSWIERSVALEYMPVDYLVEIDSEEDMQRLMETLKPEIRVQGGDYRGKSTRFPGVKKFFVYDGGMRTSKIIERIKKGV